MLRSLMARVGGLEATIGTEIWRQPCVLAYFRAAARATRLTWRLAGGGCSSTPGSRAGGCGGFWAGSGGTSPTSRPCSLPTATRTIPAASRPPCGSRGGRATPRQGPPQAPRAPPRGAADEPGGAASRRREQEVPVYAAPGVAEVVKGATLVGTSEALDLGSGLSTTFFEVPHDAPTYGVRLS